jgi:hypothetical protein
MMQTGVSRMDIMGPGPEVAGSGIAARRWLSVGAASGKDGREAGRQAARDAIVAPDAKLLIVFCAGMPDPDLVLAGIGDVAGDVPLIGCSGGSAISPDGPQPAGVVVTALGGAGIAATTALGRGAAESRREAGADAASCAAGLPEREHRMMLLLGDGQVMNHEEILAGVYGVVGAGMPFVGGAAGPDAAVGRAYELFGNEVVTGAVVGAAIASDGPFGVAVGHGWRTVGEPMIVTHSAHGDVYTLDDHPAREAYLDRLGAPTQAYTDPAAFMDFARTHPVGIRRRSGLEIRDVGSDRFSNEGWLRSNGEVPEGGVIWSMEGDADSGLSAAERASREAVAELGGQPPLGLLAFDCVSRRRLLGDERTRTSVDRMLESSGGVPVAGFYTWGEYARVRGINGYYNQTLVMLAVG